MRYTDPYHLTSSGSKELVSFDKSYHLWFFSSSSLIKVVICGSSSVAYPIDNSTGGGKKKDL